jgi:RNA polymerase sigma-70 factor (ECF subfamily)
MIGELYQQYGGMVYRRCLKILKNEQDALDCMQDVFLSATKRFYNVQHPSSYLYRIATNLSLNWIRDHKNNQETEIDDIVIEIASSEDSDSMVTFNSILDKIFHNEAALTKVIALLHLYDGYTLEEVSDIVNMSLSGVRKRLRSLKENVLRKGLQYE